MLSLDVLNPPQRRAVLHEAGPLVVFAGAGSGKTRVITYRVAHLVHEHGIAPWRVLAVTFTNKAAGEMRERLAELVPEGADRLWVGTFHATCARLLRRYSEAVGIRRDFTIYDDSDQQAVVRRVLRDLALDERRYTPKEMASRIDRAKQEALGPGELPVDDAYGEVVQRVYAAYEERLQSAGALDFGDLIFRLVRAMEEEEALRIEIAGRFDHVLVDEFQDTNAVQYRLLRALCARHRNLCVVGDDDQSIYRWRGADRRNILEFRREFPDATVVKLEQNYRSTQRILRVANTVIARNKNREPKTLWTDNDEGAPVRVVACEDERQEAAIAVELIRQMEARGHSRADVVVFYRIHAQSRVLEEALRAYDIPYRIVGGVRFYDRAEVKDVLAYLRAIHNPDDDVSLLRIINTPTRGIGKTTIERLMDAAARGGRGLWEAVRGAGDDARLNAGARRRLAAFVELMEELRALVESGASLSVIGEAVVSRTRYLAVLREQDTPEADARIQNLQELLGTMAEFEQDAEAPDLAAFLTLVTLQTSEDLAEEGDRVTLMTVHAAKGLEFPVVMVAGLEEQMFPFRGTDPWEDPEEMEEERRLAYVAFTRAREQLVLTYAGVRRIFGQMRVSQPSRFLAELPGDDVEVIGELRQPEVPGFARRRRFREQRASSSAAAPVPRAVLPGESYVDTSEGSDLAGTELRHGMRVRHARFGVGQVVRASEGVPPRVTVCFPGYGNKTIITSKLEPA